jgi:hypothetical protein
MCAVPVQMQAGASPGPGADVGLGEPSLGADVVGVRPVPAQGCKHTEGGGGGGL